MGHEIAYGAAISIIFAFFRWAVPAMSKPIAWSGVAAGIAILIAAWAMPQMNITLPVIALFLFGAICIGGAVHLAMKPKPTDQPGAVAGTSGNTMGNIDGNTGIITQGQHGDNTIDRK
jgi:hypothetical protein